MIDTYDKYLIPQMPMKTDELVEVVKNIRNPREKNEPMDGQSRL